MNPLEQRLRSSPKRSPGLLRPRTYARLQRRRRLHRLCASHVREKLPLPLCPRQPRRLSNVEHPQPSLLSPRGPLLPADWQAVVGHRETKVRPLNLEPASRRRPDQGRQSQPSDRNGWRWPLCLLLLPLRWTSPGTRRIFLRSFRFLWISFRTLLQRSYLRTSARLSAPQAGYFPSLRSCPSSGRRPRLELQSPRELHPWVNLPAPMRPDPPWLPPPEQSVASPGACKSMRYRCPRGPTFPSSSMATVLSYRPSSIAAVTRAKRPGLEASARGTILSSSLLSAPSNSLASKGLTINPSARTRLASSGLKGSSLPTVKR